MIKQLLHIFFLFIFLSCRGAELEEEKINKANELYRQGLQAKSLLERKHALNEALALYNQFETDKSQKLFAIIGDIYYQLEEYSWAILYDYKALHLAKNKEIEKHLLQAQKKLGFSQPTDRSYLNRIISLNDLISTSQLYFLFFVALCAAFLFVSLFLWTSSLLIKNVAFAFSGIAGILFLNIVLSMYVVPFEGVLVYPSGLYREASMDKAQVTDIPLLKGMKVEILDMSEDGKWIKIIDSTGKIGFVPWNVIRII